MSRTRLSAAFACIAFAILLAGGAGLAPVTLSALTREVVEREVPPEGRKQDAAAMAKSAGEVLAKLESGEFSNHVECGQWMLDAPRASKNYKQWLAAMREMSWPIVVRYGPNPDVETLKAIFAELKAGLEVVQ